MRKLINCLITTAVLAGSGLLTSLSFVSQSGSSLSFITAQPVEARPCGSGWLDRLGCTLDPTNPGDNGSLLQKYFSVSIQNKSSETIWVAVHYRADPYDTSGSCVQSVGADGCNNPSWVTNGYWKLSPGESARILNSDNRVSNRIIYFHAHNSKGETWGKSDTRQTLEGKLLNFFQKDMGGNITNFTQTFN